MTCMQGQNIQEHLKKDKRFEEVQTLMQVFINAGREIYLAGGCVRDALLGRPLGDFDLATSAQPEWVETHFDKTLDHGKKFGTITIVLPIGTYEVTTFRSESTYLDRRHPEQVAFSHSYQEDSKRRDFTINALYADIHGQVLDPQEGLKDLKSAKINCVGQASQRFDEDALRMYRALRFASQLDFSIDKEVLKALQELWPNTQQLSRERRYVEFKKTIQAPFFYKHLDLVLKQKLHPCFEMPLNLNVEKQNLLTQRLQQAWPKDLVFPVFILEWVRLCHPTWPEAQKHWQALKSRLSLSRAESRWLEKTLAWTYLCADETSAAHMYLKAQSLFSPPNLSLYLAFPNRWASSKNLWDKLLKLHGHHQGQQVQPLVTAKDLMGVGLQPGAELGEALTQIFIKQLEEPGLGKAELIQWWQEQAGPQ